MKKLILAATAIAVAAAGVQSVKAGDCSWNTAGQVLAGVAVGAVIASAVNCNAGNYGVSYSYTSVPACPPPASMVCAPAPLVYAPASVVYVPRPVVYAPRPVVYAPYRPAACPPQAAWRYGKGHRNGNYMGGYQYYARR